MFEEFYGFSKAPFSRDIPTRMVLYLADSKLTPRHFYKGLLAQLGVEAMVYRGDAKRQLHHEIELMRGIQHLQPVIIVDEAHLLDREMLEEVRFLLNFKMDSQSPMSLILVGQSELWNKLHMQSYTAFRQRIDIQCKLAHYDRAMLCLRSSSELPADAGKKPVLPSKVIHRKVYIKPYHIIMQRSNQ